MRIVIRSLLPILMVGVMFGSLGAMALSVQEIAWTDVRDMLSSANVEDRREAARFMAVTKPYEQDVEFILPLIKESLRDDDSKVRGFGLAALHVVARFHAMQQMDRLGEDPPRLEFADDDELFSLLIEFVQGKRAQIDGQSARPTAVDAFGLLYWFRDGVPEILVDLYRKHRDPLLRRHIVEAIRFGKLNTKSTNELLLDAITSKHAGLQQSAAYAIKRAGLNNAFPALVETYLSSDEPSVRLSILSALRSFHKQALDRLPEVREHRQRLLEKVRRAEELISFIKDPSEYPSSLDPRRMREQEKKN